MSGQNRSCSMLVASAGVKSGLWHPTSVPPVRYSVKALASLTFAVFVCFPDSFTRISIEPLEPRSSANSNADPHFGCFYSSSLAGAQMVSMLVVTTHRLPKSKPHIASDRLFSTGSGIVLPLTLRSLRIAKAINLAGIIGYDRYDTRSLIVGRLAVGPVASYPIIFQNASRRSINELVTCKYRYNRSRPLGANLIQFVEFFKLNANLNTGNEPPEQPSVIKVRQAESEREEKAHNTSRRNLAFALACPFETPAARGTPRACEGGEREQVTGTLPAPSERPELKKIMYCLHGKTTKRFYNTPT
ncbi:hypothetical protein C8J56DRAFT_891884 [Mycena floridula]|nr:hypothetical protein C8J56DRAFT_891884 [Mycena floridula]